MTEHEFNISINRVSFVMDLLPTPDSGLFMAFPSILDCQGTQDVPIGQLIWRDRNITRNHKRRMSC